LFAEFKVFSVSKNSVRTGYFGIMAVALSIPFNAVDQKSIPVLKSNEL
jgi:hypothetical protein